MSHLDTPLIYNLFPRLAGALDRWEPHLMRAADLPGLREDEARAAAGLQRLTNARETLDREEARARERMGELDRRLSQFSADIEREQRLSSDADVALTRLDAEDAALKDEIKAKIELRSGVDTRVAEAEATLSDAETATYCFPLRA